ncbi:MAG: RNA-guided endonuclease TnpB family protein [Pseudomonadota bacterium]|nr:RNA-guided endonuclease TnpB family protein [Pseudomonadota bacterium]
MLLVHKIELNPNNQQATYFAKACGVARFAYNWALARWQSEYEAGRRTSEVNLRQDLNVIKAARFPWMLDVTKVAPQQAIKNLGVAFKRFFTGQGKYPRFKKKGIHDAFRADNGPASKGMNAVSISGKNIKLPKIGWIRMRESLRFSGPVKSVTVSRHAQRWFASITVDTEQLPHERKNHGSIGIDLGVKELATLSDGTVVAGPKAHKTLLRQLSRCSRQLSRKKKGSSNARKASMKLARLHRRIVNIRTDALHKLTTMLVLNYHRIGIEDLNVKGMVKNHNLARSILDQSFGAFRRQLEYKADWYGAKVIKANRFFPSTSMCHVCGTLHDMPLSKRVLACACGNVIDRDLNAALNLESVAVSSTETQNACGAEGSGDVATSYRETMP